jgi:membrane protein implicated in regulation of membrane protease activity
MWMSIVLGLFSLTLIFFLPSYFLIWLCSEAVFSLVALAAHITSFVVALHMEVRLDRPVYKLRNNTIPWIQRPQQIRKEEEKERLRKYRIVSPAGLNDMHRSI